MLFKVILVLCVIQTCLSRCDECKDYTRMKRSKYYSNPPPRFYRKPPMSYPIRGPFSYTPPPGYMDNGDKNPGPFGPSGPPGPPAPYKVSKRKEGLGEEDFHNLIKYLSKQDLDRIVELAGERNRYTEKFRSPNEQTNVFKNSELDFDPSKVIPFTNDDQKPNNIEYSNPPNYVQLRPENSLDNQVNTYLDPEESQQISYLNGHIQKELNRVEYQHTVTEKGNVVFTDSESMKEEQLPKPHNLREETDYDASYTNNVPSIVQAQSNSYKLENFADLPLMNYDSKLETVNSYSVPHYTVTSTRNQVSPNQILPPSFTPVNPNAPINQAASQQSDAHLKAVKIWTHKSTGTAYTLHDDGTLSLERPIRPPRKF